MSSLQHKHKINNSYESEPSSGSGSLSEHNEYHVSDISDEHMNLPYLLQPKPHVREETAAVMIADASDGVAKVDWQSPKEIRVQNKRELLYGVPLHSSQESSFEGFNDSPLDKMQRRFYSPEAKALKPTANCCMAQSDHTIRPSPGKIVFAKFYDTIVEENSCNAVDVQLSGESISQRSHYSSTGCGSNSQANPSSELSFNGRIKSLTSDATRTVPAAAGAEVCAVTADACADTCVSSMPVAAVPDDLKLTESFVLKKYSNERSPDLFDDDDDEEQTAAVVGDVEKQPIEFIQQKDSDLQLNINGNKSYSCPTESSFVDEPTFDGCTQTAEDTQSSFLNHRQRDRELLRRIRSCLAGVPPPPSFTILQLDMFHAVLSRKEEILNFLSTPLTRDDEQPSCSKSSSLFKPTHSVAEAKIMPWADIRSVRQHGLCYNLNKATEHSEYLNLSVIERYVGAETATSYRSSPSSAKKRNSRLKMLTQSPGNRLSHLAKRRAIFSSAHLATTSQKCNSLFGPQIVLDKRKTKHRRKGTPKRKTPGSKRKNRKTPTSSARKRLFRNDVVKPGPSRETSKRALFQSPAKQQLAQRQFAAANKPAIKPEIAIRVEKSKRALFSPDHQSQSSHGSSSLMSFTFGSEKETTGRLETLLKRKRNFDDEDVAADEELASQSSKWSRCSSSGENLTPRALKIKSQSFCNGAGSSSMASITSTVVSTDNATFPGAQLSLSNSQLCADGSSGWGGSSALPHTKLQRAYSDMVAPSNSLTENQRKKLLWAVSQALQEKKISAKHESFKQYASVLARVVRRIFQEYYQKNSTSNSETMLRLAKKYVYNVVSGKNADDIYLQAKAQVQEAKRLSTTRLSGYIAAEDYQQRKLVQQLSLTQSESNQMGSCQNIFGTDNSVDALSNCLSSQTSSHFGPASSAALSISASQTSFLGYISQSSNNSQSKCATTTQQQYQPQLQTKLPIQSNATLENSSSKNNLGGVALRENVDCEQRRSGQKNFTGKDQRNVSPYAGGRVGSGKKASAPHFSELNSLSCLAKAKRQITFDS